MGSGISQVSVASASQPRDRALPVLPALRDLFPSGGLQRGSVVVVPAGGLLSLAILAGASAAGTWCAVVGLPELGVRAAAGVGVDPGRLLLVSEPGQRWPQVTAALLDGCEIVLVCPSAQPAPHVKRQIEATVRRAGGVLVVAGEWPGAQARLWVARQQWAGLGRGHGRLTCRQVQVLGTGRGAAIRPAQQWLWLPGPDGGVAAVVDPAVDDLTARGRAAGERGAGEPATGGWATGGWTTGGWTTGGWATGERGAGEWAEAGLADGAAEAGPAWLAVRAG
jgi:hypothetical protein